MSVLVFSRRQREPLLSHTTPQRPWKKVGVDVFSFSDHDYLITVDYLSGFFEVDKLPSNAVKDINYCLKQHFARHGLPLVVCTDNSPFATKEFKQFAKKYDFSHVTSSPRYPTSNGKVENAVKTMKGLMTKARESGEDVFLSLLDWRNTPSEYLTNSPSQILFNRRTRTSLPTASSLLDSISARAANSALTAAKQKQAYYYDRFAKDKPKLTVGQTVRMKYDNTSDWRKGEISEVLPYRSYNIRMEDGSVRRRISKHVSFTNEPPLLIDDNDSNSNQTPAPPAAAAPPSPPPAGRPTSQALSENISTRSGRVIRRLKQYRQ